VGAPGVYCCGGVGESKGSDGDATAKFRTRTRPWKRQERNAATASKIQRDSTATRLLRQRKRWCPWERQARIGSTSRYACIAVAVSRSLRETTATAATVSRRRRQRPGHHDQIPATHHERRRWQRPGHHDQVPATHNKRHRGRRSGHHDQVPARRRGQRPGHHDQIPVPCNEATAWAPRSSTCNVQRDNDAQLDRINVLSNDASGGRYMSRGMLFDL
jgi:hypothetical protein